MFVIKVAAALCNEFGIIDHRLAKRIASSRVSEYETDHEALTLVRNWFNEFAHDSLIAA